MIKFADAYTVMGSQLKYMTGSAEEAEETQKKLFAMSQKTGTSLTENATALVRMGAASEMMGTTTEENIAILAGLNTTMLATGTTGAQASSTMLQLTQALGSGKLAGDEFRSVMENSPAIMRNFADAMGIGVGQLKVMASEGKITTEVMVGALQTMAEKAESSMGDALPATVERGWARVVNAFQSAWDEINDSTGIMGFLQQALIDLSVWITANSSVFSSWFMNLVKNIQENWPAMKESLIGVYTQLSKLFTKALESGPSMSETFKNLAYSINMAATALSWFIEKLNWIFTNWDKFIAFVDKLTLGVVSGTAAAAGTLSGGGSGGDAWNAYMSASPFDTSSGNEQAGTIINNNFTQEVSRSDATNITMEQARQLNRS